MPFNAPWNAAWFCAFLSLTYIVADCAMLIIRHGSGSGGGSIVFTFLPMCFYILGLEISRQQREITDLRNRVAATQGQTGI
jgi:hypothetical protein